MYAIRSYYAIEPRMIMLMYSPTKKRPKRIPEYSVWKPATSSFSASGRSKGVRFDSASTLIRKIRNPGG